MKETIFIFGHQHPDTDSICSAIAYANLKKALGYRNVKAARLGNINKETQFVLDTFGVEPPELISNVKPQVSDLKLTNFSKAKEDNSISKTMEQIIDLPGRSLPVVNDEEKLIGMVSLSDIIPSYINPFSKSILKDNCTPLKNIIDLLNAKANKKIIPQTVNGDIYAITEISDKQKLSSEDMLITVNNPIFLTSAFDADPGIIVISNATPEIFKDIPENYKGLVLVSELGPFEVIRLLGQGIPIKNYVQRERVEYFMTYETIDDVKKNMLTSEHELFPVVDTEGKVLSSISRSNLVDFNRKKVILVDHNEQGQSITGVDEAEIVEVIDHHRVAQIQTTSPLYLRIEPVGCTSTIIGKMYAEHNIEIPPKIAGLMLSAIISDTLLFNSPTCTPDDVEMSEKLGKQLNLNLKEYGRKMLIAGSNLSEMSATEILTTDMKFFTMGSYRVSISQINTGDFRGIYEKLDAVLLGMDKLCETEKLDLSILMVTDIILGGTELLFAGTAKRIAELAFGVQPGEFSKYLPGVFSRKKQIVPPLMNASAY
ncbi:MAG: putative manganese-dependent inorganic diphosphatase [Eubacteriaceae bacterium]